MSERDYNALAGSQGVFPPGERRRYFRVDDIVPLAFRAISEKELEAGLARLDAGTPDSFTLSSRMAAISQSLRTEFTLIEQTSPEVARYLKALDEKLDLLAEVLLAQDPGIHELELSPVNLSAVGLAFSQMGPVERDTWLEIKMLLRPALAGICAYGKVVDCRRGDLPSVAGQYRVAVELTHLREDDRELLIHHIMKAHSTWLRQRRDEFNE